MVSVLVIVGWMSMCGIECWLSFLCSGRVVVLMCVSRMWLCSEFGILNGVLVVF